jgi:hypothetical protein
LALTWTVYSHRNSATEPELQLTGARLTIISIPGFGVTPRTMGFRRPPMARSR